MTPPSPPPYDLFVKSSRSLPALLAGAVGCALALAAAASGQTGPPYPPSGSLPSYAEGWSAPADNLLAFAVDDRDRVWLLTRDSDSAFVRLDEQGEAAETIPFAWPADLDNSLDRRFLIVGEDFMVGRYRFDRDGQVVALYPFKQAWALAAGPDGTVVRLMERLEIYDRQGQLVRRFGEEGLAPGKFEAPRGLAVDRRGRIVVAELRRLQLFSPQGKLLRAVGLPAELTTQRILSLAMDGGGYLYAAVSDGGSTVAVFDPELRYLGSSRLGWERLPWDLAADGSGRLYALVRGGPGRLLRQAVPAGGSVRLAQPLPATGGELPRELPQIRPAREEALALSGRDQPLLPYRLHASTRGISQVAPGPLVPGRLWLATEGGLVRFDSGSGQWQRWTLTDGLPEPEVRSVHSDGGRVYLLMRSSAAVFDSELLRFRSFVPRGEGRSPFANAVRVAPAPDAPGVLWWFVGSGVLRQDLNGDTWSSFPVPGEQPVQDGLVLGGGRIAVLTENEVWELRPEAKEWRRVCDVDDLDRVSPARQRPTQRLRLRSISTGDEGRTLWIGTLGDGLFRVEADSGKVAWPEETRDPRCSLDRVVRQGDRLFAFGSRCLREVGRPGCCNVDFGQVEQIRQAIPDPGRPNILWLATPRGLASVRPAEGRLALHLPPWPEPDGVRVATLLAVEGRLWISQRDGGVSAFDPATGRWATFPRLRPTQTIRRSAANGHLLVYAYGGRGRALTWIDPKTAEQVLVPGRWEDDPWGGVGDFHHDAQGLWVVGRLRHKIGQAFGVQRSDGTSKLLLEWQLSSRPNSLLPDPAHPGDFLLVGEGETLLRVHAGTGEAETLRAKVREIRRADERYVWIQGEPSARLDLETGTLATLDLEGTIFPDPGHPDRVWLLRSNVLAHYDVPRRERLAEIALPRDVVYEEVAVLGDRLWIGSSAGLLEVPLAP